MLVLGLILLAAAVVAIVEGIMANTAPVTVHMWGWSWDFSLFWAAVCGAGILFVAVVGLTLMQRSGARSMRIRRDHRALVRENERLANDARARTDAENRAAQMPVAEPAAPATQPVAQPAVPPVAQPVVPAAPDASYPDTQEHHSGFGRVMHRR